MIKLALDINKIPHFCQKLNEFDCDFDIHNGRLVLDGKSLMGLYSLNYNYEIFLKIINKNENDNEILEYLSEYIQKVQDNS